MQQLLPRASFHGRYAIPPSLGDAAQIVQAGSGIATPVVTGVLASSAASSVAAGGTGLILGIAPALAIPIIGAAIAGVTLGITMLLRSGCGQTCIVTSNWANQAEELLTRNISQYFGIPEPRTRLQQQAALENFDKVWNYLYQECSNASLGDAGRRCIEDRKAGACKWKQTADSPLLQYPGEPQPGACWNWFSGYRDPIVNDPNMIEAAPETTAMLTEALANTDTGVSGTLNRMTAQLGGINPILLIGGVLVLAGLMGAKK